MASMTVKEAIAMVEADGWHFVRQTGSHRHFKHPAKKGLVTIAGKPSDTLHPKTAATIRKQAGL